MSDNWEFALSHIDGGFLGVIGDDDGVMPGGVASMASVLSGDPKAAALIWPVYSYYWPEFVDPAIANCLSMPAHQPAKVERRVGVRELERVATFQTHVHRLPSPYWGVVSHGSVQRSRGRGGRFFNSITPDIYAAIAVAAVSDRYLATSRALTLSGESHHSNAAAQITGLGNSSTNSPSSTFVRENTQVFHPKLHYAANIQVLTGEALLQARDHVGDCVPTLRIADMITAALRDQNHIFNKHVRDDVRRSLSLIADDAGIGAWFRDELRASERQQDVRFAAAAARTVFLGAPLRPCPESIRNIYDATLFADDLRDSYRSTSSSIASDVGARAVKFKRGIASLRLRGKGASS